MGFILDEGLTLASNQIICIVLFLVPAVCNSLKWSQRCYYGFTQCISVWNLEERFIHLHTMANKEGTEPQPNITSYIENKQNGPAAYWRGKTSQWLITALEDLGAVGEMASVALHSSRLPIWSARKWHTFLPPSNKINLKPSSDHFCAMMSTISQF